MLFLAFELFFLQNINLFSNLKELKTKLQPLQLMMQVYHNTRCGKSRNCLAFLEEKKLDFEVIKYLDTPPSEKEIADLLIKLDLAPIAILRQKEKVWIENYKNKELTDAELIAVLAANPILIERPILVRDDKAIIARDLDKVQDFLK